MKRGKEKGVWKKQYKQKNEAKEESCLCKRLKTMRKREE